MYEAETASTWHVSTVMWCQFKLNQTEFRDPPGALTVLDQYGEKSNHFENITRNG
jgi:hypothetical protein